MFRCWTQRRDAVTFRANLLTTAVFSIRRDYLHVWLSVLLMVAFALVGRADQTPDSVGAGKDLQWQRDAQFVLSPPVLDLKTTARKSLSSSGFCLVCTVGSDFAVRPVFSTSRLDGETSARLPLSDLRGLRGRAPPWSSLSLGRA